MTVENPEKSRENKKFKRKSEQSKKYLVENIQNGLCEPSAYNLVLD